MGEFKIEARHQIRVRGIYKLFKYSPLGKLWWILGVPI